MGRQHKRAPQIEPEMLPTPALTDRFKGLGLRPLSRVARFIARWAPLHRTCWGNGTPKSAAVRVHVGRRLSPRRRCGGVVPSVWCPRDSPKAECDFRFDSPCASRLQGVRSLPALTFCPRGPCPFSRSPLLGFRPLLGSPPPPVSLRSHLCSQPGIISFAKTPRGLFGRVRQEGFFLEGTATGSRLLLCLDSTSLFAT